MCGGGGLSFLLHVQEFLQHVVDTEGAASKLVWNTLLELWLRDDFGADAADAGR